MELGTAREGNINMEIGTAAADGKGFAEGQVLDPGNTQGVEEEPASNHDRRGTLSTTQDGVVEVVVNNKMRAVRYRKDKVGTVNAARFVDLELGNDDLMGTTVLLLGGKLVADRTPSVVYGPNAREQGASL